MPPRADLNRRDILRLAGGTAAATALGPPRSSAAVKPRRRPNVLFLQTDQHHHGVLGCAGNPVVKTPTLDRLAAEGARFTNAVCATPFCSPTRASWLLGQWPHTHGLETNVQGNAPWLTDDRSPLENLFHDAGYRCAHFGKWHLGRREDLRCYRHQGDEKSRRAKYNRFRETSFPPRSLKPAPRPGETFVRDLGGVYLREPLYGFHERWKDEPRRSKQDLSIIGRSATPPRCQFESWLADQCIDFLEQNKDRPFFATYSVSPPHAFWVAPDPYYSLYDPAEVLWPKSWTDMPPAYRQSQPSRMGLAMGEVGTREYLRCYYAQVTMMDAFMGRILKKLEDLDLLDNTLICFTSDHGDMQGAHHAIGKSLPAFYEEIARVPLIVRYPNAAKPGTVIETHANSVDLMPTFLDYAGLSAPKTIQGTRLRPLLEGKPSDDDRPGFSERGHGNNVARMIRTREWKYSVFLHPESKGSRRELFHLSEDPWELNNLADEAKLKPVRARLEKQLKEHLEATGDKATLDVWPDLA